MKNWLVKSEEASLSDLGKYPGARTVSELIKKGLIILDKPCGPTSHQVDAWIKKILEIEKCSHGGTLDPRVSGVLVIPLLDATKLMPIILSSKKEYVALIHLHKDIEKNKIEKACKDFIGEIRQIPPKKSAVAKRERKREIYGLEVLEIQGRDVLIKVNCQHGVYIRRLAEQIGKRLGVNAHMQELRRTKSGIFTEEQCVTLQDLIDAKDMLNGGDDSKIKEIVMPLEVIADNMKNIIVKDSAVLNIIKGAPVYTSGLARVEEGIEVGETVGILSLKGEMIGFGIAKMESKEMLKRKGTAVRTDRILFTP